MCQRGGRLASKNRFVDVLKRDLGRGFGWTCGLRVTTNGHGDDSADFCIFVSRALGRLARLAQPA